MPNVIAVYGSLRQGGPANNYMRGCKWLGEDRIKARLYNVSWYPGIKIGKSYSEATTVVDLYELPEDAEKRAELLAQLDRYEGYKEGGSNNLFVRKEIESLDLSRECYVYEYNHDVDAATLIPDGDWIKNALSNQTAA